MDFRCTQAFDADPSAVIARYCDPDLYPRLGGLGRISDPVVVHHERRGDTAVIEVRWRFVANLPAAARAILDPARLTWIQRDTFDLVGLTSEMTIIPDHYADRLAASAVSTFSAREGGGTTRSIRGRVEVHALLVGGKVEAAIIDGIREHAAAEALVINTTEND